MVTSQRRFAVGRPHGNLLISALVTERILNDGIYQRPTPASLLEPSQGGYPHFVKVVRRLPPPVTRKARLAGIVADLTALDGQVTARLSRQVRRQRQPAV
jgi:hypothetical protein